MSIPDDVDGGAIIYVHLDYHYIIGAWLTDGHARVQIIQVNIIFLYSRFVCKCYTIVNTEVSSEE